MEDRVYQVIVADDDDDDQYLIKEALADILSPHAVKSVSNGLELIDLLFKKDASGTENLPDFIVLDLNMPLLDGYAVLEKMRANDSTRTIPVHVLTTSRFDHDRLRSVELGATGFYSKPYQFEDLKNIIRDMCESSIGKR